jgi:chaperonin cofactor prefoldin
MNEIKLLEYQIESHNKSILKILEDINKRINWLENDVDKLRNDVDELRTELNVADNIKG